MSPGIWLAATGCSAAMADVLRRRPLSSEYTRDVARATGCYIHLSECSSAALRPDGRGFDDELLQILEHRRRELDAKVARYISKKQGQFDAYVAEKVVRRDSRADGHEHDSMLDACGDGSRAPPPADRDNETSRSTKQHEEAARQRAEAVSVEVATSSSSHSVVPSATARPAADSARPRDSEILQLLPGFLPLLDNPEHLSSSAPAANCADPRPARHRRSELVRSSTMPPVLQHGAPPRRSSLKQPNGDRPGNARKAVRLSLGPSIVVPTQSPPEDGLVSCIDGVAEPSLPEHIPQVIEKDIENAEGWKSEPKKVYTEEILTEDLVSPSEVGEAVVPDQSPASTPASTDERNVAQDINRESVADSIGPVQRQSPPRNDLASAASPMDFNKESIQQRPAASARRRFSLTEGARIVSKDPRSKKKKKTKPVATAPEVDGASSARCIEAAHDADSAQRPPPSTPILSSSFADANNMGVFYPTRARPPPSHLRPDCASLCAVDVPLPASGFSSVNASSSYGSMLRGIGLGESYMALNFARNMSERGHHGRSASGLGMQSGKLASGILQLTLQEEDENANKLVGDDDEEEEEEVKGYNADDKSEEARLARQRDEALNEYGCVGHMEL